jgi:hypothetical protein
VLALEAMLQLPGLKLFNCQFNQGQSLGPRMIKASQSSFLVVLFHFDNIDV